MAEDLGCEPAFPTPQEKRDDGVILRWATDGLTKRELFAAMAMQGLLSAEAKEVDDLDDIVTDSVQLADALLKELAK